MKKKNICLALFIIMAMICIVGCKKKNSSDSKSTVKDAKITEDTSVNGSTVEDNNETTGDNDEITDNNGTDAPEDNTTGDDKESTKDNTTQNTTAENSTTKKNDNTSGNGNNSSNNNSNNNNSGNNNNNNSNNNSSNIKGTDFGAVTPSGKLTGITSRVSVHDPSIEYDPVSKQYYIFGSHKAWAKSPNLINWKNTSNNISTNYAAVFKESGTWAALGSTGYDISGNLWAPDVIYNKTMKKWCMYMSVNGNNYYSSIAMATADSIDGPYTYQGTVVYSGFANSTQAAKTDYSKVTGNNNVAARYLKNGSWNNAYGTNAIDPCVLYDKDGQLWMTYGSWFGGIFILKLDNNTGLRDYSYKYSTTTNVSDEYLGKRISGGYGCTGEGSYVVWDETSGYYYLYMSYCGLDATDNFSGYHMRLFRSKNIDGPYTDAAGNKAICVSGNDNQSNKGIKLMGNYFFSSLTLSTANSNASKGYMSPGHNSAIVDNNGNHYLIYHTRFNLGTEWHQVRVHQQFLNEDGWLVTAPYEYLGSKINDKGYSTTEIAGDYEFINHGLAAETKYTGMLDTLLVKLTSDGKITGDVTGTWKKVTKSGKSYYVTMVIGGVTYKGVFFKQFDESSSHNETMTFSLIGTNNQSIWGSKVKSSAGETGNMVGHYTFDDSANAGKDSAGKIGTATVNGCTVVNDSSRGKVLSFDGKDDYVKLPVKAANYSGYTIMMWVNSTNAEMWERVFDLGSDADNSMFFTSYAYNSGYRFAMQVNGKGENQISHTSALTKGKWTHVALTINKSTKRATLYVNGTKAGTVIVSNLPNVFNGNANYLGKSQYSSDPYFKGYMDDVYMFDYELSETKVKEYMNK